MSQGHSLPGVGPAAAGSGLVKGTSWTLVLKVAWTALGLLTSLVLARVLGVKGYGTYAYAVSWAFLLSVPSAAGLDPLLTREVSRFRTTMDWGALRGVLRWADRIVLRVSVLLGFAVFALAWFFRERLAGGAAAALWLAAVLVPFLAFIRIRQAGVQGLGHVIDAQLPQFLVLPVVFLLLLPLAHILVGLSPQVAVGLRVGAAGIALLVGQAFLLRFLPHPVQSAPPQVRSREWLRSALPLLFVGVAGVVNERISIVMVGSLLGPEEAGILDAAKKGAGLVAFVLMAVNMPLAPTVAGLHANGETERLQRLATKGARVAFLGSLPLGVGLIVFGRFALAFFGEEFTRGSTVLAILCLGHLFSAGLGSVALLLNMTGFERDTAKGVGLAAVVNVTLEAVLIPLLGIEGAAVGEVASVVVWKVVLAVWVYRKLRVYSTALGPLRLGQAR